MKHLLSSCLILLTAMIAYGQQVAVPPLPLTANKIVYIATITTDTSMSKEQLFHNAQEWYKHNFESADNTFIIDNMDDGEISGTGIIHALKHEKETFPGDLFFNVDIVVATGAYQYRVDSISSFEPSGKFYYSDMYNEELYPPAKPRWAKDYRETMLNNMNTRITGMIAKMQTDMKARR